MTTEMAAGASRLLGLLTYIEQVEKLKTKPSFSVPDEFFDAHQHELAAMPELQFNLQVDGDDVWMRFPRLKEIAAPDPDDMLKQWIELSRSPDKRPTLKAEVVRCDGKREVGRALLKDHPEVQTYFAWYVEYQWEPWAAAERPRRRAIACYNRLFSLQQAIASDGAETPLELVWGLGYAAWKKEGFGTPVKFPLLLQACEVTLNEKTFDLEIRPRNIDPRLEIDCYAEMEVPGVRQLEAYWRSALAAGANRVNPFDSSTFEGPLRAAVGYLDPAGAYEVRAPLSPPPAPNEKLQATNSWVLFGRKRSGDTFLEDIKRLKKKVEEAKTLPSVVRGFVEHGDDAVKVRAEQPFRGLSTSEAGAEAMELYFPMAYNDEQVSIVQKLHSNDGVVVQGPPGTGKTHTIANVVCHYLAQGKRVLVTAKGESALAVLQEKLPEAIRPLSVALLSDERDGMKQFGHSIQTIASSVASLHPARSGERIAACEERLNQLHGKIANLDRTVAAYASKHMQRYPFQGRTVTAEELAKIVLDQVESHQWFDDEPARAKDVGLPFDEQAIRALRRARMTVGQDLVHLGRSLPLPDALPAWEDLCGVHRDLVKAKSIDAGIEDGAVLGMVDSLPQTLEKAQALVEFLRARAALKTKLASAQEPWLEPLRNRLIGTLEGDPVLSALGSLCEDVRTLDHERRQQVAKAVDVPPDAELNEEVREALVRLLAGKNAFALPFGKADARRILKAVAVSGSSPSTPQAWAAVQQTLSWRIEARKVLARWASLANELSLGTPEAGVDAPFKKIASWQAIIEEVRQLTFDFDAKLQPRLDEVFGKQAAGRLSGEGESFVAKALSSLQSHVDKARLAYAIGRIQGLVRALDAHDSAIVRELREFVTASIGNTSADELALKDSYAKFVSELARLAALRPALEEIARVTGAIESAGAAKWAKRLRAHPASADHDAETPVTWFDAWTWRQAVMFLDHIDGHHKLRELFGQRVTLTAALARTYQELVALKTWLGVFNNSPDTVRQALQQYLNAVQSMGSGTGVRAVRHRRTARDAMLRAYQAVPCWILPQWRVSETIPAEIGLFDLVIIDEASQSDIWALPALLRGRKVLVVGDHKQVSPSAVGTAEEKIKELVARFLADQPHGSEMTPDKSIYDLARVVFAGNSVMLKEHFRCVPAIIEFSNREFYENDIRPLRVPKANERLDPPLVDVVVKGGHRKGDINAAEAKAIVDEIESILANAQFDGRSIGVVTLQGTAQAAYIHKLASERISPVDVIARKIAIGPPPVFQGRERDIMLVSMVLGPGDRAAANRADLQQRFNVALSRARDRMYLFRSVSDNEFSETSLNGRVIHHFRQPFRQDVKKVLTLREKCESGFELELFDELVKRGFRVEPQVRSGGYRIDFVVEGNEGCRLAIECDGDLFHGPGQWQADMARQRVLERAGWTFWRCFASSFVRRRADVIDDLLGTLQTLGIEPLGSESVDNTIWVHHKEVDPFRVEDEQQVA